MRRTILLVCSALAFAGASPSAAARFETGGHVLVASPTGDFNQVAGVGAGIQGHGIWYVDPMGTLGLRVDLGFVNYGSEDYDVPFSGTVPVTVRVSTTNNIALFGIGPHVSVPTGPLRPYGFATIGLGYFFTETSVKNRATGEAFATDTQQSDAVFAWGAGGGVKVPVTARLMIDVGAEYRVHRDARYVTEGGITQDGTTGDILVDVRQGDANLVLYKFGVTFAFP